VHHHLKKHEEGMKQKQHIEAAGMWSHAAAVFLETATVLRQRQAPG
jgi:hypothetical protein